MSQTNKQNMMIMMVGLVIALIVAMVVQGTMGNKKPEILNEEPKTYVLVASKDLSIGDTLSQRDMEWQEWPKSSVFKGAMTSDVAEETETLPLEGRLRRNVAMGEPLMPSVIVKEDKGNFVAATLGDGMRAMAIKVKAESSVGGFITPGDYVDVILTYDMKMPSDETIRDAAASVISKKAVQTVLENIRVVAVDQKAKEVTETSVARTVTIEVSPYDGEKLALAESMGNLSLSLRKLGDTSHIQRDDKTQKMTDIRLSEIAQELLGNQGGQSQRRMIKIYNGADQESILIRH